MIHEHIAIETMAIEIENKTPKSYYYQTETQITLLQ